VDEARVRSLEEAEVHVRSLIVRVTQLERMVRDHENRFDTLQTPLWKRIGFWIDGWPWHDLNGTQKRRFWHRRDGR